MLKKLIDIFLNFIYFTSKKEMRELDDNSPLIRPKIIEAQSTKDDSFFSKSANDSCY